MNSKSIGVFAGALIGVGGIGGAQTQLYVGRLDSRTAAEVDAGGLVDFRDPTTLSTSLGSGYSNAPLSPQGGNVWVGDHSGSNNWRNSVFLVSELVTAAGMGHSPLDGEQITATFWFLPLVQSDLEGNLISLVPSAMNVLIGGNFHSTSPLILAPNEWNEIDVTFQYDSVMMASFSPIQVIFGGESWVAVTGSPSSFPPVTLADTGAIDFGAIPEPASGLLAGLAGMCLAGRRRRRQFSQTF